METYTIALKFKYNEDADSSEITYFELYSINKRSLITGVSFDALMEILSNNAPCTVYCHEFDFWGEFVMYWLMHNGFTYHETLNGEKTLNCLVSSLGDIYNIDALVSSVSNGKGKTKKKIIHFINSSKIIPVDEDELEEAFATSGTRAEILADAIMHFLGNGLNKRTIGSDAVSMLKTMTPGYDVKFPDITKIDNYLREAYGGAFLYCNPETTRESNRDGVVIKEVGPGYSLDVNSLYPWILDSMPLPYGYPVYFEGKYDDWDYWKEHEHYPLYVQRFEACFELKAGKKPIIQQKEKFYKTNQYIYGTGLESIRLTLTSVELKLFFETYDVYSIEYIDGYAFHAKTGMFSDFISFWREKKEEASRNGNKAQRQIAKLFLNNIGGKFATKLQFKSRYPAIDYDDTITYNELPMRNVKGMYLPVACFMISYAKDYIVRFANMLGDKFLYSDTDSLHFLGEDIPDYIPISATEFGAFKVEYKFVAGKYIHAKCYIEISEDGEIHTAVAGLPKEIQDKISYEDFKPGFKVSGKLIPFRVVGGAKLVESVYTL